MMVTMADDERASRDDGSAADNPAHEDDAIDRRITDQPTVAPGQWVRRAVLALVLLVIGYVGWRLSVAFFPRWWAQRIADQVQGRFIAGTLWGLFYGFVFTLVPLLVLFQIRRRFFSWTWRAILVAVAVLLAVPNWLTLSVVTGTSNAAHAGERIMDVDAPNFRVASLIGAVIGAVLALAITSVSMRMTRRKLQIEKLKDERDDLRGRAKDAQKKGEEKKGW